MLAAIHFSRIATSIQPYQVFISVPLESRRLRAMTYMPLSSLVHMGVDHRLTRRLDL